jgi:hypothetical protein
MSSIIARGYKSTDVENQRGGYQEPSVVTIEILNHNNGHFVRPNRVVLKYFDFKKNVDPNVHVKVFNSIVKDNVETSEKYIINAFNYTLRDTTSDWVTITCQNFLIVLFRSLHRQFTNVIERFQMMSKYTWS